MKDPMKTAERLIADMVPPDIGLSYSVPDTTVKELVTETRELRDRREHALNILTRFGGVDGAHHKAWAIDQAIRVLCGVECGPHGYPGDKTNPEYLKHVYESCKDGDEEWAYSWDAGVAP